MYVAQYWRKDQMGIFDVHHQRHIPQLINVCISKGNDLFFQMYACTSIYTTCTRVNTQPLYRLSLSALPFSSHTYIYTFRLDNYVLPAIDGRLPTVSQLLLKKKKWR